MVLPEGRLLPTMGNSLSDTTPTPIRTLGGGENYPFRVYF
jgi:hypothetical protein